MNIDDKDQPGISRRGFLLASGGAICTLMLPRSLAATADGQPNQEFIECTCGKEGKMKKRVLVTYASKCGSTGGVAEAIGQVLCGMGATVDVRLTGSINDISPYKTVIVGSAIRMGNWLPEAADFVNRRQDELSRVPCAYFVVCLTMKDDTAENRKKVMAYLDPVRKKSPKIQPAAIGLFPGALDFKKLSFGSKAVLKMLGGKEGDYRNWAAVKTWAGDVSPLLLGGQLQGAAGREVPSGA
jgi:menaquinone-dependent protoporphyrinogen oxidase